jgi:hypothetical protein
MELFGVDPHNPQLADVYRMLEETLRYGKVNESSNWFGSTTWPPSKASTPEMLTRDTALSISRNSVYEGA